MTKRLLGGTIDLDGLSETEAKELCKLLLEESTQLKFTNHALLSKLDELQKDNSDLHDKINSLHSKATSDHLIVEQNEGLKKTVELLQNENEQLKKENSLLKAKLAEYENRISQLEARDKPITVREAMRILEHCICFEAVGKSKTKFAAGNYSFLAIAGNDDEKTKKALETAQQKYNITANHIKTMNFLKDCGDYTAHSDRPFLSRKEWKEVLLEGEDGDDNDYEEAELASKVKAIKVDLLCVMEQFFPAPVDDDVPWQIEDYTSKKTKKVPALKLVDGK